MTMSREKYSSFVDRIEVDPFLEAIGFFPEWEDNNGNLCGYCPFPENHEHGDTTGKFAIHPEKKVYNCWLCGGGSWLSLVMELNSWDSETAEEWLRQFATSEMRNETEFLEDFLDSFQPVGKTTKVVSLPYFNERVLDQWDYAGFWCKDHGISRDTMEVYGPRAAPKLFKPSPRKGKYEGEPGYEGPAIIFPHYWRGKLVGWQQRWLDDDRPKWCGKWTNTVDFPGNETLYGMMFVDPKSMVYAFESVKTVMYLDTNGPGNAVATFGDTISDNQLKLLRSLPSLMLCPDNDKAGRGWLDRAYSYLRRYVPDLWVCPPVPGLKSDLADLDRDSLRLHIGSAVQPKFMGDELTFNWASATTN